MTHFSPNSVAGCISNVECSVGGNLELRQTIHDILICTTKFYCNIKRTSVLLPPTNLPTLLVKKRDLSKITERQHLLNVEFAKVASNIILQITKFTHTYLRMIPFTNSHS
jgi:hypothetical protein